MDPHIAVCICTYKRPGLLTRLLEELRYQETGGKFTYSVVVVDNDCQQSAADAVAAFSGKSSIPISYCVEPEQNIALARNRALAVGNGCLVAFIDDDEYPERAWLSELYGTLTATGADGVLGPVEPYFEQEPPKWAREGGFFQRPRYRTGYRIGLRDARTGNVLLRRRILEGDVKPFRGEFATGGEDVDFFRRKMQEGRVFVWCDEAVVREAVPAGRCSRTYLLRRALLRGKNSLKNRPSGFCDILKSCIAITIYFVGLPLLLLVGHRYFMEYLIKICDHAGKLLALVGLNPLANRDL